MRTPGCLVTAGLLLLSVGCNGPRQHSEHERPVAVRDDGPSEEVKRHVQDNIRKNGLVKPGRPGLIGEVRSRMSGLKPGMTEAQVMAELRGLPLGEEVVVSRTVSGGKTVRYALSAGKHLELSFIPLHLSEPPPGGLREARLVE